MTDSDLQDGSPVEGSSLPPMVLIRVLNKLERWQANRIHDTCSFAEAKDHPCPTAFLAVMLHPNNPSIYWILEGVLPRRIVNSDGSIIYNSTYPRHTTVDESGNNRYCRDIYLPGLRTYSLVCQDGEGDRTGTDFLLHADFEYNPSIDPIFCRVDALWFMIPHRGTETAQE